MDVDVNVPPGRAGRRARRDDAGVAGNARLTAANAALLLVLLAIEGVTVLRVRALLTPHVFVGMLLVRRCCSRWPAPAGASPAITAVPRPTSARGRRPSCCACSDPSWCS